MYPGAHEPGKPAVVMADSGEVLTYGALEERSVRLSRVLHAQGLRPGDGLAVLAGNGFTILEAYWAAMRSGLHLTALNHHLQPAEIAYVVDDCGARALVTTAALGDLAQAVAALTPQVRVRLAAGGPVPGHDDYEAALAAAPAQPLARQPRGRDMLYSSGTTGRPKGIRRPLPDHEVHEGTDPLLDLFGPLYGIDADTVYLCPAPLYHAAPLRFSGMVHAVGGTVVVLPRFDAREALAAVERHRVTHSQWVPTMFVRMLKLPEQDRRRYDLSSHRVAVHAAAPCPVEVKRAMIDWWGPVLQEYYSSTESVGVTAIDSHEWLERPGSVGRSVLGVPHVCDGEGRELPVGTDGLIWFENDVLPFSYHRDPAATRAATHPAHDTWATTGDIGHLDEDGYLYLTDRKSFMIISGGVNIYPQEVEDALALHPAVDDLAVVGVPDEEMGERVEAVVQAAPGAVPGPELAAQLQQFLRERIAHYKVPRTVRFVDALPRTPTGKLQKHLLRTR